MHSRSFFVVFILLLSGVGWGFTSKSKLVTTNEIQIIKKLYCSKDQSNSFMYIRNSPTEIWFQVLFESGANKFDTPDGRINFELVKDVATDDVYSLRCFIKKTSKGKWYKYYSKKYNINTLYTINFLNEFTEMKFISFQDTKTKRWYFIGEYVDDL